MVCRAANTPKPLGPEQFYYQIKFIIYKLFLFNWYNAYHNISNFLTRHQKQRYFRAQSPFEFWEEREYAPDPLRRFFNFSAVHLYDSDYCHSLVEVIRRLRWIRILIVHWGTHVHFLYDTRLNYQTFFRAFIHAEGAKTAISGEDLKPIGHRWLRKRKTI